MYSVDRSVVRYFSSQKAEVRNCRPHKGSRSHRALHAEKRRFCKGRMNVCTARGRRSAFANWGCAVPLYFFAHLRVSCGLGEQPFTRSHHSGELQNSSTATLHNQSHMCRFGHCVTDTFLTARPHELRCELPPPFHLVRRQRLASASSPHSPSSGNASLTRAHANPTPSNSFG